MKEPTGKHQVTLRDYLFIVFHRKKYFLFPASIIFFLVSIGSFFLPKYYASSVLLLVQDENSVNPLTRQMDMLPRVPVSLREQLKTLTEKILNYPQLSYVVNQLGLADNVGSLIEREKLIYKIRSRTDVRMRSAEIVEIIYEHTDPRMAQRLVNTMVHAFIDYDKRKKREAALTGVEFAESQAEIYRKALEESEQKLADFRKQYTLQTPGKDTDINISLLINYQTQLTNTLLDLETTVQQEKRLRDQIGGKTPLDITTDVLQANPIISSLSNDLNQKLLSLGSLMQSTPSSDTIPKLEMEIDDIRQRLAEEIEKTVDSQTQFTSPLLYSQLSKSLNEVQLMKSSQSKNRQELEKLVGELEQRINSLPEQERQYANLLRDSEVNRNIYEMLRMKVEENRIDAVEVQQRGLNYEIVEEGRLPLKPSRPQKLLISIAALLMGILTGFCFVFLMEMGDHSFRGVEDARQFLTVPVVGSVMKIVTREDFLREKKKQRKLLFSVIGVLLLFALIAGISSYLQDKKITESIVKDELGQSQS